MSAKRGAANAALASVLLISLLVRLHNIGFGLPSLYDPDEPIFMIKALELLTKHTLNPQWFGHPGTTTIYLLAMLDVLVAAFGLATGAWHNTGELAKAAFADPSLLFIPARCAMAIIGVVSVWFSYAVGRRLYGTQVGLIAAAFLAVNGVHIAWSQVVRTDIHASVFMLAALLFAIRIAESGRTKDYILAGLFTGFAIGTKWPSATIFVAIAGASASRILRSPAGAKREIILITSAGLAVIAGLFLASPFIFLDWHTVLANLSNEARPHHLGHTGAGLLENGWWYLWHPIRESVGILGFTLIGVGFVLSIMKDRAARWTIVPAALAFFLLISAQRLVWSRWVLPLLPMLMIFLAVAIKSIGEFIVSKSRSPRRTLVVSGVAALSLVPSISGAIAGAAERANDTRSQAAKWATGHIAPGSSVVLEHLELSLRTRPWHILFPVGTAGCVDAKRILGQGVNYEEVEQLRNGSPIVDLGNVAPSRLDTCQADYAILTYYDLYRLESAHFPHEVHNYEKLLAGGRTVALFQPLPGQQGGPLVRIVKLRQQPSSAAGIHGN